MPKSPTRTRPTDAELIAMLRECYTPAIDGEVKASLSERFLLPPFTVLDARQGYWQNRKRAWIALGIKSELGRGEGTVNATPGGSPLEAASLKNGKTQRGDGRGRPLNSGAGRGSNLVAGGHSDQSINIDFYAKKRKLEAELKKTLTTDEARGILVERGEIRTVDRTNEGKKADRQGKPFAKAFNIGMQATAENGWQLEDNQGSGTSIFDPVICELVYRWFSPLGGSVLDPFAGGSVRGIIADKLGRSYIGIDLREEQIAANYVQAEELGVDAKWIVGDSVNVDELVDEEMDLVFSCPPYADLERYSDDPRDISTMEYGAFLDVYRQIIIESCKKLRNNRFACFVVGDLRDKSGLYRGFPSDTIRAFEDAGLRLYNDAVLVTSVGSLPIRVGKQFTVSRKMGKTHQNVLVFVKGDPVLACKACGTVDVSDLELPPVETYPSLGIVMDDVKESSLLALIGSEVLEQGDLGVFTANAGRAALLCDIARHTFRKEGRQSPRVYIGLENGWEKVVDAADLSYVVGEKLYVSRKVYPAAVAPPLTAPPVKVLGIGKRI